MPNHILSRRLITCTSLALAAALGACGGDSSGPSNTTPFASAGANQLLSVGSAVTLDASGSSDGDGDALTFAWTLTRPAGSAAALSSASAEMPTFTADVVGAYNADLTVSDGVATADATTLVTAVASHCSAIVDLFPTPVRSETSPFDETDDASVAAMFDPAFQFTFYGQTYDRVYLNSNGGMTFGAGLFWWDPDASFVDLPTIGVFWGDMDAAQARDRAAQMYYEACSDRFIVYYQAFQDLDDSTWDNTATVTLFEDGTITIEYGEVGSEDIMVGIFDGTHTSDDYVSVQSTYAGYIASSGTILFDAWGAGPAHAGELSNQTITFDPAPAASVGPAQPTRALLADHAALDRGAKTKH